MLAMELTERARVGPSAADQHAGIIVTLGLTGKKGSGQNSNRVPGGVGHADDGIDTAVDDDVIDAIAATANMAGGEYQESAGRTHLGEMGLSTERGKARILDCARRSRPAHG